MTKVSVVIPTRNRPVLVQRAIRCALEQTYKDLDVVVVVDGPDPATEQALQPLVAADSRVRVLVNAENQGLAESRNIGVRNSTGKWIAFLDDDDEWFPTKIEKQMKVAESLGGSHAFVVTRFVEKSPMGERVWPEQLPSSAEHFSEYMFCRRGMLIPSTYLVSRSLMLDVPFTKGLRYVEDMDWLLRATADPRTQVGAVGDPCVMYDNMPNPSRESVNFPWRVFYTWAVANRHLFTPKAFAMYMVKGVVPRAREAKASMREQLHLLSTALLLGSFSVKTVFFFVASAIFSRDLKRKVRELVSMQARAARREARSA